MADRSPVLSSVLALAISWLVWAVPARAEAEETTPAQAQEALEALLEQAEAEETTPAQAEAEETTPAQAEDQEAEADQPAKARRPRARRRQPNTAEAPEGMWWNDPALVEHLSLSDASRSAMDGHYKTYLEKSASRPNRDLQEAFLKALREGDWKGARARVRDLVAEANRPLEAQGELKISVLSLLSDEQRSKLIEKKPDLLRRVWSPRRSTVGKRIRLPRRPKEE